MSDDVEKLAISSEACTRGVRVEVRARYSPEHSAPQQSQWFFLYTIRIANESDQAVQLLSRHWIITDGTGHVEEVRGPGVVGAQPLLQPGEGFEYTSGCPLSTPFGSMEGTFHMVLPGSGNDSGEDDSFDASVGRFELLEPGGLH